MHITTILMENEDNRLFYNNVVCVNIKLVQEFYNIYDERN
jgi:hypothetical protein